MAQTKTVKQMLLVTDENGRVVAAAYADEGSAKEMSIAIKPLARQQVHKVEVPENIAQLSGHNFHLALSHATFDHVTGKLKFPQITSHKRKH